MAPKQARPAGAVRIPFRRKFAMVHSYARDKIAEQARAVAFITAYLAVFQVFVLRAPVVDFLGILAGVLAVVVGLAFFMEGLFIGIMPLGERCGLRLPARVGLPVLAAFAAVLGVTATYAEPAIGLLRAQGGSVLPWQAPLLYFLLNGGAGWTVTAVALGVGGAVVLGVFRFLRGWPFKPFVMVAVPALLALTWFAVSDPRSASIVALAWDTGGVTTGPVTVPLVIALGIGVSRIAGRGSGGADGFGVVAYASALPVAAVLALGLAVAPRVGVPSSPAAFFDPDNRAAASFVVGSENELRSLARGALSGGEYLLAFPDASFEQNQISDSGTSITSETPDRSETLFTKNTSITKNTTSTNEPSGRKQTAGIQDPSMTPPNATAASDDLIAARGIVAKSTLDALKAIVPLALVLLAALLLIVREKPPRPDEIALGLVFSVVGLALFSVGLDRGLTSLGRQAGSALPKAWTATERSDLSVEYRDVDPGDVLRAALPDGGYAEYLAVDGKDGPAWIPFDRSRWNEEDRTYLHVPEEKPVAGLGWGYALVLLFAFAMGVGATVAEPSLNALGITLEELTTGTFKKSFLVKAVAAGVGVGMAVGFARILFDWPFLPLVAGPYLVALLLTAMSPEEISAIAWDSGGVTTGPITVPLVIAAGLGVGSTAGAVDSFGILALASAYPIIAVLAAGAFAEARRGTISKGDRA